MNEPTNEDLIKSLRRRVPEIGEPLEFAIFHPAQCKAIADRLEATTARLDAALALLGRASEHVPQHWELAAEVRAALGGAGHGHQRGGE